VPVHFIDTGEHQRDNWIHYGVSRRSGIAIRGLTPSDPINGSGGASEFRKISPRQESDHRSRNREVIERASSGSFPSAELFPGRAISSHIEKPSARQTNSNGNSVNLAPASKDRLNRKVI